MCIRLFWLEVLVTDPKLLTSITHQQAQLLDREFAYLMHANQ